MKFRILILSVLITSGCGGGQNQGGGQDQMVELMIEKVVGTANAESPPVAFIITGQSNACGKGDPALLTSSDKYLPDYIKFIWGDSRELGINPHYGIEIEIKNRIVSEALLRDVYIIKACYAGHPVIDWIPHGPQWGNLMTALVMARVPKDTIFAAMFFIQGETDRGTEGGATTWHTTASLFIENARRVLMSDFPVIYSQIGLDIGSPKFILELRQSQAMLPILTKNVHMVDTSYIEKFDQLHYTYPKTLGELMWNKYKEVEG